MKVLLIGSGGREHALARALEASASVSYLCAAPGNAGIAEHAEILDLDPADMDGIAAFAKAEGIGLVVIGPEAPLVAGLADVLEASGVPAFGPTAAAAVLEGSKGFTKDICQRYGIPTAAYGRFTDAEAAKAYIRAQGAPIVVKADGLAAGKGVVVAMTETEALEAVDEMMAGRFGEAGASLVIEEFMEGEEASLFALSDGTTAILLGTAQDHKRVGEGDTGPNTGGMGAYSPAPCMTPDLTERAMREIVQPTVDAMAAEGRPFVGVLYAGLILTAQGPKLVEYNVRFGDPETQVLMPRLWGDLAQILLAARDGRLDPSMIELDPRTALTVVLAANGYPGDYAKGEVIGGLDDAADAAPEVIIFHAGTRADADGRVLSNGGRVLAVTALGDSVAQARDRAYAAVDAIDWPGGFCRRDIGWRAL
ncbi:phosphoribosylamine--glycine ligase [Tistrella bauzanensis]|uniref:phosphoribosylamine--glycine ligase n=1 Tax=Tistrella bauzanensis TaxID=657419 RepID=UPI00355863BC